MINEITIRVPAIKRVVKNPFVFLKIFGFCSSAVSNLYAAKHAVDNAV